MGPRDGLSIHASSTSQETNSGNILVKDIRRANMRSIEAHMGDRLLTT